MLKLKIAPENDELRKHHEHIHGDGKFAEAEGKIELSTYGTEEIGEVPRSALVMTLMPNELIKTPMKNRM